MDIKLPSIKKQKKIIADKKEKIRTSFELPEDVLTMLENESEAQERPPSEIFREIIEETHIDTSKYRKRLKNLTVFKVHAEKLLNTAEMLVSEKFKGKKGPNKSYAAEVLIRKYFETK